MFLRQRRTFGPSSCVSLAHRCVPDKPTDGTYCSVLMNVSWATLRRPLASTRRLQRLEEARSGIGATATRRWPLRESKRGAQTYLYPIAAMLRVFGSVYDHGSMTGLVELDGGPGRLGLSPG
jgi:hypothetical protein